MSILRRPMLMVLFAAFVLVDRSSATAAVRYGGVEIGAKGVKASAIELDEADGKPTLKVLALDKKTIDVTIAQLQETKFEQERIDVVANVIKDFIAALGKELNVPEANIKVVASSGVPFVDNYLQLVDEVRTTTGKNVDKIEAREEAALTAVALVPKDFRSRTLVVDIGSGNTKGGAFLDDSGDPRQFQSLDVPLGTTSLSNAIDAEDSDATAARLAVALKVARRRVGDPLKAQVQKAPVLLERSEVLFAGGAVWAMFTILKPETALDPFPRLTVADIKDYVKVIGDAGGEYPEVDFSRIADAKAREKAQEDYDRIRGKRGKKPTFTPKELQSGAALLEQVADVLRYSDRSVYFDRNAVTAWITAKITPVQYRHLLPQAYNRNVPAPKPRATAQVSPAPVAVDVPQKVANVPPTPARIAPPVMNRADGQENIAVPGRQPMVVQAPVDSAPQTTYTPRRGASTMASCCGRPVVVCPPPRGCCGVATAPRYVAAAPPRPPQKMAPIGAPYRFERSLVQRPDAGPLTLSSANVAELATGILRVAVTTNAAPHMFRVKRADQNVRISDSTSAVAQFDRGYHSYWGGDYPSALADFNAAIEADQRDARFWYFKGLCEWNMGLNQQARRSLALGVALEVGGSFQPVEVSRSLERVQGPQRSLLRDAVAIARVEAAQDQVRNAEIAKAPHASAGHELAVRSSPDAKPVLTNN